MIQTGCARMLMRVNVSGVLDMAKDGSLEEVGFSKDCYQWMDNWIKET